MTKRGVKYPERIRNWSKANTSIMFCGNAAGDILPPYVCYKAERMYIEWTQNGPENARYNRSSSGWFEGEIFEDFFFSLLLPRMKKQDGTKVMIGDNLSSHISVKVIEACEKNNIKFIPLLANATHLIQPLDVAYFGPLKRTWRKLLDRWKESIAGAKVQNIPKSEFPSLIKELMEELKTGSSNIVSGFRKCGLYPCNRKEPLSRLPKGLLAKEEIEKAIHQTFVQHLEETRKAVTEKKKRKKNQVNIPSGKSISYQEALEIKNSNEPSQKKRKTEETPTAERKPRKQNLKGVRKDKDGNENESDQDFDTFEISNTPKQNEKIIDKENFTPVDLKILKVNDFVLVEFTSGKKKKKNLYYVGQVLNLDYEQKKISLKLLRKSGKTKNFFVFPNVEDLSEVNPEQIKLILPKPVSDNNHITKRQKNFLDFNADFSGINMF